MSHTTIAPEPVRRLLDGHDFVTLFREHLGWDRHDHTIDIPVGDHTFRLAALAEKRSFAVFQCSPDARGQVPDRATRDAIERVLARTAHEHLVIFADKNRRHQVWMWVRRVPGKPASQRSYDWFKGQATGQIIQRVLPTMAIGFEEDDATTLPDVRARVAAAFDVEKVTKKFFERFQKEHAAFHKFIGGIKVVADRDWYASVMLNRLMFCYFIQKKGLLDGDTDYLRNRLAKLQSTKGKDKFWTFYQHFLLRLFHEGLSTKPGQRSKDLDALIGRIPYLNGGLFDIHEIEERYTDIEIPDNAFEQLFKFFDEYRWHLDERPLRDNNEINPDVLGYIFEKYINQKQMGAYYTKEDITGYISQNTIIPFILDQAAANCTIAFVPPNAPNGGGSVWRLLQADPDRYIYEPVRRGVIDDAGAVIPLPKEIAAGITDLPERAGWNKPAAEPFGLPTETWREHVARRERCLELRRKLAAGEVSAVNDLVTLNLEIRQFAGDVIDQSEGPDLLRAVWKAVESVTVLDPTCGSGAFLFAALNILEPLYEACLDRMGGFLDSLARDTAAAAEGKGRVPALDTFADFKRILDRVADHPNRRYFILKSIIVNNLYGVDIMDEACEICKLRLFLKLVAQVEEGAIAKIEPLPDIDFNIRAGNTLVGFATLDAVRKSMEGRFDFGKEVQRIETQAVQAAAQFALFRQMQTSLTTDSKPLAAAKAGVRAALQSLHDELDEYLASQYGIDPKKPRIFTSWQKNHEPFHWLVDFYGIMSSGGFDVIVGNPPYIEYAEVRDAYQVKGYVTEACRNLFAFVLERCIGIARGGGRVGLIIPVASVCTDRYGSLQALLHRTGSSIVSNFNDRPSKLFDGLEHIRLCIVLQHTSQESRRTFSTKYNRWFAVERPTLFQRLEYAETSNLNQSGAIAKIGTSSEAAMLTALTHQSQKLGALFTDRGRASIYYTRKLSSFVQILDFIPEMRDKSGRARQPSELKQLCVPSALARDVALAALNSTLFYWYLTVYSDCRNLNRREIESMPLHVAGLDTAVSEQLARECRALMADIRVNSKMNTMSYEKHGTMTIQCTFPRFSKSIIDRIDQALAEAVGLPPDALEFLVNFEVKYRLGEDQSTGLEIDE